jgi:hypothetical protein
VIQGGIDSRPILDDLALKFDKDGDLAAPGLDDPLVEGLLARRALDGEDVAQSLLE